MTLPQIDITCAGIPKSSASKFRVSVEKAIAASVETANLRFLPHAELSILLADDKNISQLNHRWRKQEKPTNVLSFPGKEIEPGKEAGAVLGDIAISIEMAEREAQLENRSFEDHFSHLMVHGFLHLFGYDHMTDDDAETMENLEREILAKLGIDDPYAERMAS